MLGFLVASLLVVLPQRQRARNNGSSHSSLFFRGSFFPASHFHICACAGCVHVRYFSSFFPALFTFPILQKHRPEKYIPSAPLLCCFSPDLRLSCQTSSARCFWQNFAFSFFLLFHPLPGIDALFYFEFTVIFRALTKLYCFN